MTKDEAKKFFLRGYERGLRDMINDVLKLTARGYGATELSVVLRSKLGALGPALEGMERKIADGEVEVGIEAPTVGALRGRGSYLIPEERPEEVFELLRGLAAKEARPLCISRTHPKDLAALGLEPGDCVWLTRQAEKGFACASPTDLVGLTTAIHRHLEGGNGAIAVEGLEYLTTQNGFPAVLKFVQTIHEKVVSKESYLLMSANPEAFKESDYRQLVQAVTAEL